MLGLPLIIQMATLIETVPPFKYLITWNTE